MEVFSQSVFAVVLLLGILVFVHEAGHFLVGKLFKIPVEIFSIGFGPTLLAFKRGETQYRLSVIPLGGFVKFYGSLPSEEVPLEFKGREFFNSSRLARMATISAGPIANLILAVFAYTGLVSYGIKLPPAIVGEIIPGSPAERAGLQFGDKLVSINDKAIVSWKDVQRMISGAAEQQLHLRIKRNDQEMALKISPESVKEEEIPGKRGRIGISPSMVPSVFTRLNDTGILSIAGIQTGDRAIQVVWDGQTIEVKYWRQFLAFLQKLSLASIDKPIVFNLVVREEKPELASTVFGPERSLQVSVEKDWRFDPLTLIESLGVNHSQLTIFKSEEPAGTLQKGDMLIAWDGKPVSSAFEFSQLVSDNRQPSAVLSLLRKGQLEKFTVNLKAHELQKAEGRVTIYALPVSFWGGLEEAELVEERYTNPLKAVWFGLHETIATTQGISRGIFGLLTGELPLAAIGGPIAIAKVASDSVQLGWQIFFQSLAIISINLALINLIPIPVLDGGQLVLLAAEAALRRPVPEVAVENYQKLGFMMVLALVVIATYNDLGRFWASMLKGVGSMF